MLDEGYRRRRDYFTLKIEYCIFRRHFRVPREKTLTFLRLHGFGRVITNGRQRTNVRLIIDGVE